MEKFLIVGDVQDALTHLANGYCLVVQSDPKNAFLVEGMVSHGANRDNVPIIPVVVDPVIAHASVRQLSKEEILRHCRQLHDRKDQRVFGFRTVYD